MGETLAQQHGRAPTFRRPARRDAIDLARDLFLHGERVDMGAVSAILGISRTTLNRWVGDRERLISLVLAELVDTTWGQVIEQATGEGHLRALDAGRRFMEVTAQFPPLRRFAQREPQLALRVLLSPNGLVAQRIRAGLARAFDGSGADTDATLQELIDAAVQVGTALEWTPIVIGEQAEIERAMRLIRTMFDQHSARLGAS